VAGAPHDDGQGLLTRLSNEVVKTQKEFFGKGPVRARSYVLDDMLVVVMHGGLTTAERTMLGFGEADLVRQFRQTFENHMTEKLTGLVEDLTGRKVVNYQSQVMFDPDRIIEMFVFDRQAPAPIRIETARGLLADRAVGEADEESDTERSSSGGEGG
jgi:uncharacterized protein YbcI